MKKVFLVGMIVLICGTLLSQQRPIKSQQIKQLKAQISRQNIIISDVKLERNNYIVEVARLNELIAEQRNGIIKSQEILQEAIDNETPIDYKALIDTGWDLSFPADNGKKPKGNSRL